MSVFDFKSVQHFGHTSSPSMRKGVADVYGTNDLLPVDGLSAQARVRQVRSPVSRQLPSAQVLMSRSIPLVSIPNSFQAKVVIDPSVSEVES